MLKKTTFLALGRGLLKVITKDTETHQAMNSKLWENLENDILSTFDILLSLASGIRFFVWVHSQYYISNLQYFHDNRCPLIGGLIPWIMANL